ncbi:MAG: PIN domain-containing protein [Methanobacteriota archaeon]
MVVSDLVRDEVFDKNVLPTDFNAKISELKIGGLIEEVEVEEKDDALAGRFRRERGLHLSDALHAALAIRTKSVIVTRNIKHFKLVEDLVEIRKPEDLL